jgi:spermidine synthase
MPSHQGGQGGESTPPRVELLADADRPGAWMLLVDGVPQSHVDLADPLHLELEYVRRLGHVIDLAAPERQPLRVLHLGGGGLTLARYVAAARPGSQQLAVESDPQVAALVAERLPGAGQAEVWVADAREALARLPAASFDLVVADLFAGASTPAHLTSVEFTTAVAAVLTAGGILAVNVGDGPPLAHARGRVAALRSLFQHTCVIAEPAVLHGRRYGNLVVASSGRELPVAGLTRRAAADPFPARVLAGAELDGFSGATPPITDAAPVPSPTPPPGIFA